MSKIIVMLLMVVAIFPLACTQQGKSASQARANDFPSVKGYDLGYPIPYDPNDPYVALDYINEQFDGVWNDVDAGQLDVTKYFTHAPKDENYGDPNRPNPTPNSPHLTPEATRVYTKILPEILKGNNPAQAVGWCYVSHPPTTTVWNQFTFTPNSMDVSLQGGGGVIYSHIYMDGRPHPANLKPSETGHLIAHWEGATLVIDGVGYKADRDVEIGLLNSDQQHVVMRYRRLPPDLMEVEYTVTDPKVFTEPWTFKRRFRRTSTDIQLLRDNMHCVTQLNPFDPELGGVQQAYPDGRKLQDVPKE
jgi:hypothetical protein